MSTISTSDMAMIARRRMNTGRKMQMKSEAFNIDCMEYMRDLPDKAFDLAVCDPPYFSGPEKRLFYGNAVSPIGVKRRQYPKATAWKVPGDDWYREVCRVSRFQIIFGINYFSSPDVPCGRIVWDKCNGSSSFSDCEIASCSLITSVRIFRYMWNGMCQGKSIEEGGVMQGNKGKNEKRIHPTQKPVALYLWLFQRFAKAQWKVLDTHLGSGSSRIAAYRLGLDFVGCEIDGVYFKAEEERFREEKDQGLLFSPEELSPLEEEGNEGEEQ